MQTWPVALGLAAAMIGGFAFVQTTESDARVPMQAAANGPVAVELFTSQGCSSCPPADALFEKLAREPGVVAITRPVALWDRLGWRDTLALPANTRLQQAYAARGGPGDDVYTPQAVVQGGKAVVGSDERALRLLIARAAAQSAPKVSVTATAAGGRTIAIEGATSRAATVTLLALRSAVPVQIGSGENGGRKIHYANVVVGEKVLGNWSGGAGKLNISADALRVPGADRAALIVRQGSAGPIVAARYL